MDAMKSLDLAFCRELLKQATRVVRERFPAVVQRDAWVYHFHGDHWEFHGPDA